LLSGGSIGGDGLATAGTGGIGAIALPAAAAGAAAGAGLMYRATKDLGDNFRDAEEGAGGDTSGLPVPGDPENEPLSLGYDLETGQFRVGEYETACRVQTLRGIKLTRLPKGASADWIDEEGKTYDAMGNFPGEYLTSEKEWRKFETKLARHVVKADYTPLDVTKFNASQIERVRNIVARYGGRVFLVEE
jgi:hypothetical protein